MVVMTDRALIACGLGDMATRARLFLEGSKIGLLVCLIIQAE